MKEGNELLDKVNQSSKHIKISASYSYLSLRNYFYQVLSDISLTEPHICGLNNFVLKNGRNVWLCDYHVKNGLGYLNDTENRCNQLWKKIEYLS